MGVNPAADKRTTKTWIDAIIAHQFSQVKKPDEQAIAILEFDNYIEEYGKTYAPELTRVEITYFEHEYFVGEKLVAAISYDHDLIEPWVVTVQGVEQHRANSWSRCNSYIYLHYKQDTLEEVEEQGNECIEENVSAASPC